MVFSGESDTPSATLSLRFFPFTSTEHRPHFRGKRTRSRQEQSLFAVAYLDDIVVFRPNGGAGAAAANS